MPVEPNCYEKKYLILVNLVPVWNRSENKNVEFGNLWVTDLKEIINWN
jgi:hypothetical protein